MVATRYESSEHALPTEDFAPNRRIKRALSVAFAVIAVCSTGIATAVLASGGIHRSASPAAPAATGKYWYLDTVDELRSNELVKWMSPDGTSVQTPSGIQTVTNRPPMTFSFGHETLSWADYMALPSDAADLKARIEQSLAIPVPAGDQPSPEEQTFLAAMHIIASPCPETLRAAAFQVMSAVSGVSNLGDATNRRGRTGTKLKLVDADGTVTTEIIDTQSYTLLEDHRTRPGGLGDVWWTTIVQSGYTDVIGQTP